MLNVVIMDKIEDFSIVSGCLDPVVSTTDGTTMKATNNFKVMVNGYALSFRAKFTFLVDEGYEFEPTELLEVLQFDEIECYSKNGKAISPAISSKGEREIIGKLLNYLRYNDYAYFDYETNNWQLV